MSKKNLDSIRQKTDVELHDLVGAAKKTIHNERFKDAFSRKASVIRKAKKEVAQALTLLSARRTK
jgi:ribosomal protein L29